MNHNDIPKPPHVTIIFPNFNGGSEPIECLSSIYILNYPRDHIEIIIIDNGSTDGSLKKIKKQRSKIKNTGMKLKVIENNKNFGFAVAINQGIKASSGDYIFIGNDDLVIGKNSISSMIAYMEKNPEVGITGGKIFQKNQKTRIISNGFNFNRWTGKISRSAVTENIHQPDWLQGCALMIPKKVLNKIGLLDEGFSPAYFEDFDLCRRAKKAGFRTEYLPSAYFWHGETITGNKNKPLKYFFWYKNKIRFVIKNLPLINILSILTIQLLLITPYRALILKDGRFFPFCRALFWNIKNLYRTISDDKKK